MNKQAFRILFRKPAGGLLKSRINPSFKKKKKPKQKPNQANLKLHETKVRNVDLFPSKTFESVFIWLARNWNIHKLFPCLENYYKHEAVAKLI